MKKKLESVTFDPSFTKNLRIAIVRTTYYKDLIDNLESYAKKTLMESGVKSANIETFTVPGSWEIPVMAQTAAESKKFDAIIAFGILVKGETYHFFQISNEVGRALMQISIDYAIPVGFEVLSVDSLKQAEDRAGKDNYNKGIEAANAVLQTLLTLKQIHQ